MPIYYDNTDLSPAEKQKFILGAVILGMTTGMLFYDSLLAGGLITACCGLYLPSYKGKKKAAAAPSVPRPALFHILIGVIGTNRGSGPGGVGGVLAVHI